LQRATLDADRADVKRHTTASESNGAIMRRRERPQGYQLLGVLYPGGESETVLALVALGLLVGLGLLALGIETGRWYFFHT